METEHQVILRVTIPVYGLKVHVDKTVQRVRDILRLSFSKVKVEVEDDITDDPDQLSFDHG